jgi:hypothetical protein
MFRGGGERMLSPSQVADFEGQGFLNAGRILGEEDVEELRRELERILGIGPEGFGADQARPVLFRDLSGGGESGNPGPNPVWQIVNIWEA